MFIVLSGPPFVNKNIHPGTAYNLILKDFYFRYFSTTLSLSKSNVLLFYGWDMHGLPLENQVKDLFKLSRSEIYANKYRYRQLCVDYAYECINLMSNDFALLQLANKHNTVLDYYTESDTYKQYCYKIFNKLLKKNLIYRDKKVLNFCIFCESTLANAEVDYKTIKITSWYYKFKSLENNTYFVIWTTTPWTIMLNEAIAYNPLFQYTLTTISIKNIAQNWITISTFDFNTLKGEEEFNAFTVISQKKYEVWPSVYLSFDGKDKLPIISSVLVENTETGLVHISPNHGESDLLIYNTKANYSKPQNITDSGYYTFNLNLRITEYLQIYNLLKANVISTRKHKSQYPHCWRCKNQSIKLARDELFLRISELKEGLLSDLKTIKWNSVHYKNMQIAWIENAHDWCLTRTRLFGVSVPTLISDRTFDVWFESGASFLHTYTPKIDLVVEGVDQIRGWFYTLAVLSYAYFGEIAYKAVHVHGYLLDSAHIKLSKSKLKQNYTFKSYVSELQKNNVNMSCFRYYLLLKPDNQEFKLEDIKTSTDIKTSQKILHIWNNCKIYIDNLKYADNELYEAVDLDSLRLICEYIFYKLSVLILQLHEFIEALKVQEFALKLKNFIICDLSHQYIRFIKLFSITPLFFKTYNLVLIKNVQYLLNLITGDSKKLLELTPVISENFDIISFETMLDLISQFRQLRQQQKIPLKITISEVSIKDTVQDIFLNIFKKQLNIITVNCSSLKTEIIEIHSETSIKMNIIRHIKSGVQKAKKNNILQKKLVAYIDLTNFNFELIKEQLNELNTQFVLCKLNTQETLFSLVSLKLEIISE